MDSTTPFIKVSDLTNNLFSLISSKEAKERISKQG
jgi:hypothetical protein